jgi:flagellar hook-associated protein 2
MTTTSSSTISSLGVGSGLDANSIVTKLVALERQPITNLQTAADKLQTKISAYGQIQSAVSSFRDAAKKLANPEVWGTTTATSSDSTAVTFSTSSGAATGNYAMSVSSLATSQAVVTKAPLSSATATVGAGTLSFEIGDWSSGSFVGKTGASAVSITVAATDTLEGVRDKINAAGAGVTASIINDTTGARLVMNSSSTGAANGFRITATDTGDANDTDANGLSALTYNPPANNATTNPAGTTATQAAGNAKATINGVEVTSATNKFADVLTGISFTVGKVTTSPVNVSVTQDNDTISKAVSEFATTYTTLANLLKTNTKYDDATKAAGTLQGDGTAVGMINQLRSALTGGTGASSTFSTLSSVGVEIQSDGTLSVNSTKLTNALGKLSEVKKMFANADLTNSGNDGIATRLRTLTDNMLSFDGTLASRTSGLNKAVAANQKQQDALDTRAALYEKRLRAQYTALDTTMATISTQSSYVSQMITAWNKA